MNVSFVWCPAHAAAILMPSTRLSPQPFMALVPTGEIQARFQSDQTGPQMDLPLGSAKFRAAHVVL
jgi:hypothetical protein